MQSALVLNATYEPLSVVPVRRAVCLVLSEKAEILHDDGTELRSARRCVARPLVVRLRYVVKVPYHRRTALSRRAVFARDDHRCQYCGGQADSIDHVMPRSRGGEHVWENVAAACRPCNLRKRDRTPDEAGHAPRPPPGDAAGAGLGGGGRRARARVVEAVPGPPDLHQGVVSRAPWGVEQHTGSAADFHGRPVRRSGGGARSGGWTSSAPPWCSARRSARRSSTRRRWRRGRGGAGPAAQRRGSGPAGAGRGGVGRRRRPGRRRALGRRRRPRRPLAGRRLGGGAGRLRGDGG